MCQRKQKKKKKKNILRNSFSAVDKSPATLRIPSKTPIAALFVSSDFSPLFYMKGQLTVKFVDFRL